MKSQGMKSLAVAVGLTTFATNAQAYIGQWHVQGNRDTVVATDCSDCEEDLGIIIACQGRGLPAKVTVNGASSQYGQNGAIAPISFNIDGQNFTRQAKTVEYGLIGFTPEFDLQPNDPLIEALQGGRQAFVSFNRQQSVLGLQGSRDALHIFKSHCGWNQQVGFSQPQGGSQGSIPFGVQPGEAFTQPNQDGLLWFTASYGTGTSTATRELRYAIPETDAVIMIANCGANNPSVYRARFSVNFGNATDGELVNVGFNFANQQQLFRPGFVYQQSSESAGVELLLSPQDQFWSQLTSAQSITISVQGQPGVTIPGASQAGAYFMSKCG